MAARNKDNSKKNDQEENENEGFTETDNQLLLRLLQKYLHINEKKPKTKEEEELYNLSLDAYEKRNDENKKAASESSFHDQEVIDFSETDTNSRKKTKPQTPSSEIGAGYAESTPNEDMAEEQCQTNCLWLLDLVKNLKLDNDGNPDESSYAELLKVAMAMDNDLPEFEPPLENPQFTKRNIDNKYQKYLSGDYITDERDLIAIKSKFVDGQKKRIMLQSFLAFMES